MWNQDLVVSTQAAWLGVRRSGLGRLCLYGSAYTHDWKHIIHALYRYGASAIGDGERREFWGPRVWTSVLIGEGTFPESSVSRQPSLILSDFLPPSTRHHYQFPALSLDLICTYKSPSEEPFFCVVSWFVGIFNFKFVGAAKLFSILIINLIPNERYGPVGHYFGGVGVPHPPLIDPFPSSRGPHSPRKSTPLPSPPSRERTLRALIG